VLKFKRKFRRQRVNLALLLAYHELEHIWKVAVVMQYREMWMG